MKCMWLAIDFMCWHRFSRAIGDYKIRRADRLGANAKTIWIANNSKYSKKKSMHATTEIRCKCYTQRNHNLSHRINFHFTALFDYNFVFVFLLFCDVDEKWTTIRIKNNRMFMTNVNATTCDLFISCTYSFDINITGCSTFVIFCVSLVSVTEIRKCHPKCGNRFFFQNGE